MMIFTIYLTAQSSENSKTVYHSTYKGEGAQRPRPPEPTSRCYTGNSPPRYRSGQKNSRCATLMDLRRQGEGVEVALSAQRQADGGYFFEALWVLVG